MPSTTAVLYLPDFIHDRPHQPIDRAFAAVHFRSNLCVAQAAPPVIQHRPLIVGQ